MHKYDCKFPPNYCPLHPLPRLARVWCGGEPHSAHYNLRVSIPVIAPLFTFIVKHYANDVPVSWVAPVTGDIPTLEHRKVTTPEKRVFKDYFSKIIFLCHFRAELGLVISDHSIITLACKLTSLQNKKKHNTVGAGEHPNST